jgi:hypothetical protein
MMMLETDSPKETAMKRATDGAAPGNKIGSRHLAYFLVVWMILLAAGCGSSTVTGSISGVVRDGDQPVSGVAVTLQGTDISTITDAAGTFILNNVPAEMGQRISAWKDGYYCGLLADVPVPASGVVVNIRRHLLIDYESYEWVAPENHQSGCMQCHPALTDMGKQDAHLGSALNPRFLSAYYGQDVLGNQSPNTTYKTITTQWGTFDVPQPFDTTQPYYGPGWRIDFPASTGTCTSCHIPGAATNGDVDPRSVTGADKYGVHCDFCHKIGYVHLDKSTGLPPVALPGVQNIDLYRPDVSATQLWSQLFMGSLADGNSMDQGVPSPYGGSAVVTVEAKRTLYSESRYCAPCHYGGFWGQPVYTSYKEWADSPYADEQSTKFKTCQGCHMPSPVNYNGSVLTNIAPGKGGIERNPSSLHSHNMTVTAELLRNSLTMNASASLNGDEIAVDITLTNDRTGHAIPTDSPLRHLILLVEARDGAGNMLTVKEGPTLPQWCGVGEFKKGYYANMPGKAYAKVLKEMWTDVVPAVSYWRHTSVESDSRLAALATDKSNFIFQSPGSRVNVTVTLIYRRAFIEMMEQKKWASPDVVIAQKKIGL